MNDLKRHENAGQNKPRTLPRTFETRPPYLRDKLEPGMLLLGAGDERESAVVIAITAVGIAGVLGLGLARFKAMDESRIKVWHSMFASEGVWSLDQRPWSIVTADEMETDGMPAEVVARMREFEAVREAAAQRPTGIAWRDDKIGDLEKVIAEQNATALRGAYQRLMPEGYKFIPAERSWGFESASGGTLGLDSPEEAVRRAWTEVVSVARQERDEVRAMLDEAMTARDRFKAEPDLRGAPGDTHREAVNRAVFATLAKFRDEYRDRLVYALRLDDEIPDDEVLLLKACSAIAGYRVLDQVREALATPPMACVVTHAKVITARREEAEAGLRELVAVLGEPFGPEDPVFGRAPSQDAADECKGLATAAVLSIGRERIAAIGRSLDAHRRSTILPAAMEEALSRISVLGRGLHKVAEALGCGHKVPPPQMDVDPPSVEGTVDAILGAIHSIRQRVNVLEMLLGGYGRLAVELAQDEADKGNALLSAWGAEKNAEAVLAAKVDYIRQRARRAPTADIGALDRLVLAVLPDSAIVGALQGTAKDKEATIVERVRDLRVRRDFAEVALAWFAQYTKRAPKDLIAKWAGVDPRAALDLQGEWVRSQLAVSLERKAENERLAEVAQQAHVAMDALRTKVRDAIA